MNLRRLLGIRGIHYFATRFGPRKLRGLAFDEKYRSGDWNFSTDGTGELSAVICRYLREGDLLIMGCGGASILQDLEASKLKSALGIDLSQEAIRLAGRFASEKISFQLADMVTFQCPRPYDVILFSESLNYVPGTEQKLFLQRLSESLKPGGVFVVTIAQARRYAEILEGIRKNFDVLEDHPFSGSNRHLMVFNWRGSHA
jgi:2-polyprenyl-3-methyl-5-hydroxy-6-metoxy-1,4-benzoquinol methylase